jgi:lipopolysaccharide biosynthesis glycosyltransferase
LRGYQNEDTRYCGSTSATNRSIADQFPRKTIKRCFVSNTSLCLPVENTKRRLMDNPPQASRSPKLRHLVFCSDAHFLPHLATALASVLVNSPEPHLWRIHVVSSEWNAGSKETLRAIVDIKGATVQFHTVGPRLLANAPISAHVSIATYYRLLLPWILGQEVERIVYLDSDLVVEHDLARLHDIDLLGACVGAVYNPGFDRWAHLRLDPYCSYFNAGVLVIDLPRWREERISDRALKVIELQPESLVAWDQNALNRAVDGKWQRLDLRWNLQSSFWEIGRDGLGLEQDEWQRLLEEPWVVHYTGTPKPWQFASDHPLRGRYWHYRRQWFGGVDRPRPTSLRDVAARTVKAFVPHRVRPWLRRATGRKHDNSLDRSEQIRIGVLTYHYMHNFGAQLQAMALQQRLRHWGYNSELIDYVPLRHRIQEAKFWLLHIARRQFGVLRDRRRQGVRLRRNLEAFAIRTQRRAAISTSARGIAAQFDCVIVGSDEVWNCDNYLGFQPAYFLDFGHNFKPRRIGFAVSMGAMQIDKHRVRELARAVAAFDEIMVRDKATAELVKRAAGREPQEVLDPTFLWDFRVRPPERRPYLMITGRMNNEQVEGIRRLGHLRGLTPLGVGYRYPGVECVLDVDHHEWIGHIKGAAMVVSSLFHASVYAIKCRTPFVVLKTVGKEQKIRSLLERFALTNRLIGLETLYDPSMAAAICGHLGLDRERYEATRTESLTLLHDSLQRLMRKAG